MLIQNLKKSQNIQHFSPSKQTPLYENKQNEREIIQWRLLCFILKLSTDKIWLCKNERESVNGAIFPRMRLLLFFSQTLIFLPTLPAQTIELLLQSDKTQIEKWRTLVVEKRKIGVFIKHVRLHISQKFTSSLDIKPGKNNFRSRLQIRANKYVYNTSDVAFWSVLEPYFMKLTKSFGCGDDICSVFISILNLWATTVKKSTGKKS